MYPSNNTNVTAPVVFVNGDGCRVSYCATRVVHGSSWVGLGRVFSVFGWLGWAGSTIAKVLKLRTDYANTFKARLEKIWLHRAVKLDFYGRSESDRYRKPITRSNSDMLANDSRIIMIQTYWC